MARPVFWTVFGSSRHENSPSVRVKRVIELGLNFKGCFVRANKSHEVHAYAQLYKREAPRHLSYPATRKLAAGRIERGGVVGFSHGNRACMHASVDHRPAVAAPGYAPVCLGIPNIWGKILICTYRCILLLSSYKECSVRKLQTHYLFKELTLLPIITSTNCDWTLCYLFGFPDTQWYTLELEN